jgi:CMP-N,N'-diacetyllegionaminic acid synthase
MAGICALIPARAGSKGVPDKNIRALAGEPLLAWSVRAAVLASSVRQVIVSTDSAEYAEVAQRYGANAPFLRSEEASNDQAGDEAVVAHLIDWFAQQSLEIPEFIVYLRPTTPLRSPDIIDEAVRALADNQAATSLRSVHRMAESAYKTFEQRDGVLLAIATGDPALDATSGPRQGFPDTWIGNGYVDVFRSQRLLEGKPLYGDRVMAFETGVAPEIDVEDDFDYLDYQVDRQRGIHNTLFNNKNFKLKASS